MDLRCIYICRCNRCITSTRFRHCSLTTLQVSLIIKLSLLYDKPITKDATTKIVVSTIAGGLGQTVFRQGVKFFPGIGMIIGASVAGTVTFGLGQAVKYALENDIEITPDQLKEITDSFSTKTKRSEEHTSELQSR